MRFLQSSGLITENGKLPKKCGGKLDSRPFPGYTLSRSTKHELYSRKKGIIMQEDNYTVAYRSTKNVKPLLLLRIGDFWEAMDDDAETIARELELTLTSRNKGETRLCGIPYHSISRAVELLNSKGYVVSLATYTN